MILIKHKTKTKKFKIKYNGKVLDLGWGEGLESNETVCSFKLNTHNNLIQMKRRRNNKNNGIIIIVLLIRINKTKVMYTFKGTLKQKITNYIKCVFV